MRDPGDLWKLRARSLRRARKATRNEEPEGLHDLRVALRRAGATAGALGARPIAREAKRLVASLARERQLQVDRQLLMRVGKLGALPPDATTAVAARWEKLGERASRRIARKADGGALRRLLRRIDRRSRRKVRDDVVERLERARRSAEETLHDALEGKDDDELHRHRVAVKEARYLAEDLAALGVRRFTNQIERESALQETLGRWNDLRMFRRRLTETRDEAEQRGAVTLAGELERLLAVLEPTIATVRRTAVEAARMPEVVSIANAPRRPRRIHGS